MLQEALYRRSPTREAAIRHYVWRCIQVFGCFLITRLPTLLGCSDLTFNINLESGAAGSKDAERIRAAMKKILERRSAQTAARATGPNGAGVADIGRPSCIRRSS